MRTKTPLSEAERERRRWAVEQAVANNRIEGIETPPAALAIFELWIAGNIDSDECTRRIGALPLQETDFEQAEQRMAALRETGYAVSARYDRRSSRIVVDLSTGAQLTFPTERTAGLSGASPDSLAEIEISPAGLGLHWPKLDADVYLPALLDAPDDVGAKFVAVRRNAASSSNRR
jgi:hypothetical protein